jgi:GntR family transcriptional regulator
LLAHEHAESDKPMQYSNGFLNSTLGFKKMSNLSSSSPVPLYLPVADTLRQRIERGVWAAGSLLPTLEALAQEFDVARVSARQAVQLSHTSDW